jgi:hypothetical protein
MVEQGQGEDQVDNATVESEAGLSRDEADIDIRHLSKVWPTGRSGMNPVADFWIL